MIGTGGGSGVEICFLGLGGQLRLGKVVGADGDGGVVELFGTNGGVTESGEKYRGGEWRSGCYGRDRCRHRWL